MDLQRQFRNPEKQQILPVNITKEIIDEISILYREEPIYQVLDENGKIHKKDQKLWEEIMKEARYASFMDKLDRWCNLLGTVLVKASFVDPSTGQMADEKTKAGKIQLDMLHGGVYDIKHGASPHYITELLIGFGKGFKGFSKGNKSGAGQGGGAITGQDILNRSINLTSASGLGQVEEIYWGLDDHKVVDSEKKEYKTKNPYGMIPAVPFFNSDPAHYYFLPINEPLIYANHAVNMRMTDLNHIAKFQSFGIPVIKGGERPTSVRQGRPVDDFNILRGGSAQSSFGGLSGLSGLGAGGSFRNFDAGLGSSRDGNADANALGFSLGPDTAVSVGEKGDFKFAHPQADITGLLKTIQSITDIVRINHGLRAKFSNTLPDSGFGQMMEKMGVIENNVRRSKLFAEREEQLFQVIKTLHNTHNNKSGDRRFSDTSVLKVTHRPPKFPVDPKTEMETIIMERAVLATGDRQAYKKLYPYLSDAEINATVKNMRADALEQAEDDAHREVAKAKIFEAAGILEAKSLVSTQAGDRPKSSVSSNVKMAGSSSPEDKIKEAGVSRPKIDNKTKHAEDSGVQGSDPRKKDKRPSKSKTKSEEK